MKEQSADFLAKHKGLTLDIVDVPYNQYEARYAAGFASGGTAPDIFMGQAPYYAKGLKVAAQAPADLQTLWNDKLVKATAPSFQVDGKWYSYPVSIDLGMQLFYNTDMFQAAGLDPAKPPTTFDELREYAKKLAIVEAGVVKRNGMAIRYSGAPTGIADKALPYVHAYGGRLYAPDESTADGYLNSEGTVRGLTFMQDLIHKDGVASVKLGSPDDTFTQGLSAMTFREGWFEGFITKNAPNIKFKVAPYPVGPAGYPKVSLLFNWGWMVNDKSPRKDVAWDWLRTVGNAKTDLAVAKLEGYLPVWEENFKDPYIATRGDYGAVQKQLTEGPGPVYSAAFANQINTKIGEAFEKILQGQPIKATLDAAVPEINDFLTQGKR